MLGLKRRFTMSFQLIYPIDNTKVSNPKIKFRWNGYRGARSYLLEIFQFENGNKEDKWVRVMSKVLTELSYEKHLVPGKRYHCKVTALTGEVPFLRPMRDLHYSQPHITRRSPFQPSTVIGKQKIVTSTFYIKQRENYLKKYLRIKAANSNLKPGEHLKPIIPLFYCFLERYHKWIKNPNGLVQKPLDILFAEAIDERSPEFRSLDKIEILLAAYHDHNLNNLKEKLFGPKYIAFPEDDFVEEWTNKALDTLFNGSWLDDLKGAENKVMILEFKQPRNLTVMDISLLDSLRIPVKKEFVEEGKNRLEIGIDYYLRIVAGSSGEHSDIPLHLKKDEDGNDYFFDSPGSDLSEYDSADFKAELWMGVPSDSESKPWSKNGYCLITGGKPVILGISPSSSAENSVDAIRIKVRDGGIGKRIILDDGSTQHLIPGENSSITRIDQTLLYQVFVFRLIDSAEMIHSGEYSVTYENWHNVKSINTLSFHVNSYEYKVQVKAIECKDESDPEWWGDDSISFQTFINTNIFLQNPASSQVYDGFNEDSSPLTSFKKDDNNIYPNILHPSDWRIIEDILSINMAIYEHDDLDWLEWLFNEIIDFVQSFLAHLVDVYTCGTGGFIILAALEVSGLNDMREQAIDSLVSGWEVEILHEDGTTIQPNTIRSNMWPFIWELDMATDESRYKVTFIADRELTD